MAMGTRRLEAAGRGEIDMGLVNHYYQNQEAAAAGDAPRAEGHFAAFSHLSDGIGGFAAARRQLFQTIRDGSRAAG